MEDFFRFGVGIEKNIFEKFLSVRRESNRELSLKSSQFFGYFTEFTGASARKVSSSWIHFPGSSSHFKSEFLVHSYTFYDFQMAITL